MIRRTLRNGLVAAIAAVAVFPVTAVACPGTHTPAHTTPPQISMPSLPPTIPQPSVPGLPGTSLPKPKAPKHHAKRHVTTRSRHCAKTHARRHMVTTHARRHVTTHVLGRVATHHMRLNVRYGPGTGYRVIGSRHAGRTVAITCKKRGSNILGNKRWYKLAHHKGYVSAHYVVNRRTVPWC